MAADTRLLRFLVAHGWDAVAAADAYVAALAWRQRSGADGMRDLVVSRNAAFFGAGGAALSEIWVNEADAAVQELQPRTFTRRTAAGLEPLLDRLGNLVYIECPGLVDNAGIAKLGGAKAQRSFFTNIELGVLLIDELSRRQGRLVLMCRVMDMTGLKLVNPFKSKDEKEGEKAFKDASGQVRETYPTTTFKNFLINLPAAGAAGPIVKAFAPARSAKKFVMLGAKFRDELHRDVDPSMLPQRLGGVLDDGVQWKRSK